MNKKNFKIVLFFVILFSIFMIIALIYQKNTFNNRGYFVIDGQKIYEYSNREYYVAASNDIDWNEFNIYSNNEYRGVYYLVKSDNKYYFFDKNNESYKINSPFVGISKGLNFDLISYSKENFNDEDYRNINEYLKKEKINYNGEYSEQKKYVVDLDNNGNMDYVYVLSNQLYSDNSFYVVFVKIGSKYLTVSFQNESSNFNIFDLGFVVKTGDVKYNDIILSYYEFEEENYQLFRYSKDSYISIK